MALGWLRAVLACVLLFAQVGAARAQQVSGGGARGLDAPQPPGASPPPPAAAVPPPPPAALPPLDPHPRRGLTGIIVGWSGLGAAVASLAMMATCDPLFRQAGALIDTDEYPDVEEDVDTAVRDGTRVCRTIYGVFAGAGGGMAVLGLPIGYGVRHRYRKRLAQGSGRASLQLDLRPTWTAGGGMLWLRARFR